MRPENFPHRFYDCDFETDVVANESKLVEEYDFEQSEVALIVRHKPTFLLFEQEHSENQKGIKSLEKVLC
jgi:hypothetical protein